MQNRAFFYTFTLHYTLSPNGFHSVLADKPDNIYEEFDVKHAPNKAQLEQMFVVKKQLASHVVKATTTTTPSRL